MINLCMPRNKKIRIAVFGGGAHTIPGYRALLNNLTRSYEIILYSEFSISKKFDAQYSIRYLHHQNIHRWLLASWFLIRFSLDHFFWPFNIIHSHSTYPSGRIAILLKKIYKIPVVLCLDAGEAVGIKSIQFGDLLNPIKIEKNKTIIEKADVVTALTQYQAADIKNVFLHDVRIITRGVDLSKIKTRTNAISSDQKIVFLHVGYLHPVKDPITLINCLHLLTKSFDCRLIQIGQDYMNGEVQRHANELGIGHLVDFRGFVEHEKIYPIFQEANVLLHTSLFESQGFVVNEALAHGLLVCGTQVGLLADLSEQCCITIRPGDFEALAQQVSKLMRDPTRCEQLRDNGLRWTREHDLEWTTNRYKEIYKEVTGHQ